MATVGSPPRPALLLLFTLILITTPPPSVSISYTQFQNLYSLAHSLMTRVGNHREARGDFAGAKRARLISSKLERGLGLGLWGSIWSFGWDYVRNYAWRDAASFEMFGVASDARELLRSFNDLSRMESEMEKVQWISRNYRNVLRVSGSILQRLLKVFSKSGPIREVVETLQKEIADGGLLQDCLDLGGNDLKGLIQILKDLALDFSSSDSSSSSDRDEL